MRPVNVHFRHVPVQPRRPLEDALTTSLGCSLGSAPTVQSEFGTWLPTVQLSFLQSLLLAHVLEAREGSVNFWYLKGLLMPCYVGSLFNAWWQ